MISSDICRAEDGLTWNSNQENRGFLDFKEYMLASNVKIETTQDKLDWIFRAFDADNGGTITEAEIRKIVIYLFKVADFDEEEDLLVACIADIKSVHQDSSCISELTELFLRMALGVDGDGEITKEEFIKKGVQSKFLKSMMKN